MARLLFQYVGCSQQCFIVWLFGLLELYLAQKNLTIDDESCTWQQQPINMQLLRDEKGTVTLQYSNTSHINKPYVCDVEVIFDESSFIQRYSYIVLDISIVSEKSCLYSLDVFTGSPSNNKAITTLDCKSQRYWTGQWPSSYLILRYKMQPLAIHEDVNNTDSLTSVIRFSTCRNCYKMPSYYYPKYPIKNFEDEEVCVDDSYVLYQSNRHSVRGFCGRIPFNVKDSVSLCFRVYSEFFYSSTSYRCQIIIKINGQQVMDNKRSIWKMWCLPWSLKGKSVLFDIKKNGGYGCLCSVQVKTNSTNKHTSCPVYRTTTQARNEWSPWSSSGNEDSSDPEDGHDVYKVIGACIGFFIFFVLCFACCRGCYNATNEGTLNQNNDTARSDIQITHQNRSSPRLYQSTHSSEANIDGIGYLPLQPPINGRSIRGISESAPPYEDIQRIGGSQNSLSHDVYEGSLQSTPTTVHWREPISNTNDSPNGEPPPPSYEDVCRNPIYFQ